MKFVYIYESFNGTSKKTGEKKTYYVVKLALTDDKNTILQKSQPIIWLTEEQYNSLISSKN